MTRKISFALGEYYHVYNRGTDKRKTFLDRRDHIRFLASIYFGNSKRLIHPSDWPGKNIENVFHSVQINFSDRLVDIGAYCLMPNHFHLLVREKEAGGIPKLMQKLQTGYSLYFNKKYQRTGSLFESKFKAQHVDNDHYLHYLLAYIHLNPVKIIDRDDWESKKIKNKGTAKEFLGHYDFSSYHHYLGQPKSHNILLSVANFPDYFRTTKDFDGFISEWINFGDEDTVVKVEP